LGQSFQEVESFVWQRAVGLDGGEGCGTASGAAEADGGDVDPGAIIERGDFGEVAGLVFVPEREGIELTGKAGVEAVDFADEDAAPADRPASDTDGMIAFGGQGDTGRIGVRFLAQIHLVEFNFQIGLLRDFQTVLELFVVRCHAENAGDERGEFYDETGRAVHGGWLRTPLRFDHISSPFDPRRMHPILRRIVPHNGLDYAASSGTPVWAAADGEVTWVGARGANGNLVSLRHSNGYETHYAHLSRFASGLERGDRVEQRQVIGFVGSTGRSTGPHLHFGLKHHGRWVDPAEELNGPGRMMPGGHRGRYRRQVRELQRELAEISVEPAADEEEDEEEEEEDDDDEDAADGEAAEASEATD